MNHNILPEELIIQIVARLPIKNILKLKSVCKVWYKLLSEGYFIQLFDQISIGNPLALIEVSNSSKPKHNLLFCVERLPGRVSEIQLDFIKDKVEIRASCNGFLWCSSIRDKGLYYVCNPMTRQYKELPRIKEELLNDFIYAPNGEALFLGLVCDLFNRKFNVFLAGFRSSMVKRTPDVACIVYDSETNTWNEFNSLPDNYFIYLNMNQNIVEEERVCLNGTMYGLCEDGRIVFLDLKHHTGGLVPSPVEVWNENSCSKRAYMLDLDGLLSLVQIAADDAFFTIWVLKDRYIKQWEVVEEKIMRSTALNNIYKDIYRVSQSGDHMFFATHKEDLMYNRKTKAWTNLFLPRDDDKCTPPLLFRTHYFRSTLFSLFH